MMPRMLQVQEIADHVYIKEHRYIYLQETQKKGTKVPFFVITYFFPLLKTNLFQKEEPSSLKTTLFQKKERPLSRTTLLKERAVPLPSFKIRTKGEAQELFIAQSCRTFFRNFDFNFCHKIFQFLIGKSCICRLESNGKRHRFFAFGQIFPFLNIKHTNIGNMFTVGIFRGRNDINRADGFIDNKGQIFIHGLESRKLQLFTRF